MSEYEIVDVRKDNSIEALSSILECPKLRFYTSDNEGDFQASFPNCRFPFILVDTRTRYKRILTDVQHGFGFESKEEAALYFNKVKDNPIVFILSPDLGKIDWSHRWIFRDGNKLAEYLDNIQLPLNERRCHVILNTRYDSYELIVTETVGNNLDILPMKFIDFSVEKDYYIIALGDPEIKKKLREIFRDYNIKLTELSVSEECMEKEVEYFYESLHQCQDYIVTVKDKGSNIASFLSGDMFYNFNNIKQAEKAIDCNKNHSSVYVPISLINRKGCIVGGVVSTSSKEIEKYLLETFSGSKIDKKLSIFYFGQAFITKSEITEISPKDNISIEVINFY